MPTDAQGHALTAASDAAAAAYDHVVQGYLKYRADAGLRLKAALALDPEMAMGQVLQGAFAMLAYSTQHVPRAREAAAAYADRTRALGLSPDEALALVARALGTGDGSR